MITGRRYIVVFFETRVLKEVRILRYLHNNSVVLILKFQNKAIVYYTYTWKTFVADLIYDNSFWYFLLVPLFSL